MRLRFMCTLMCILTILTVIGSLPLSVNAKETSEGIVYSISSGKVTITGYKGKKKALIIPQKIENKPVTTIGKEAFDSCEALESISIPVGVTKIDEWAFYKCTSLNSIYIPSTVTEISAGAFARCSSLSYISVDSANPIYDSREGCNAIITSFTDTLVAGCKTTTIPTDVRQIGKYAFYGCTGLKHINLPYNLSEIGLNAFYHCDGIESVSIPANLTTIGEGAFDSCKNLKSVKISEGVKNIGNWAFSQCTSLEKIIVDEGNITYDSRNGCNAIIKTSSDTLIAGCKATTIPEGVKTIGEGAFYGCTELKSLSVPASVKSIEKEAFYECNALKDIYYGGTAKEYKALSADATNTVLKSAEIHYTEPETQAPTESKSTLVSNQMGFQKKEAEPTTDETSEKKFEAGKLIVGFALISLIVIALIIMWIVIIKKLRSNPSA